MLAPLHVHALLDRANETGSGVAVVVVVAQLVVVSEKHIEYTFAADVDCTPLYTPAYTSR